MNVAAEQVEISAESFENASLEQLNKIAGVLGLTLREATRELLTEETLALTDEISELTEKGGEEALREALKLTEKKTEIANILFRQEITADTILAGYTKHEDGTIEITLPQGATIQEAGEILNRAAENKGFGYPVFYEGDKAFWEKNEANPKLCTKPGESYRFRIPPDSVSKTKAEQVEEFGPGASLGAIAIAEACERLKEGNDKTLFKDVDGDKVWVRGSAPGVALCSSSHDGVYVYGYDDDPRHNNVAFAPLASVRD